MIEIYIGSERLDTFKDEDVNIKLSVQNIKDISKIFADYTQNFSVPASRTNNAVFKHYYNADISGGFAASLRQSATLILDKEPFREGSIELLGVNMKNGVASSYEIVFFSAGVNLKDLFGEDQLTDLDLSAYTHEYTNTNIENGITQGLSSGDVIYPLISPVDDWFYDSSSGNHDANNIHYHSGGSGHDHGVQYYALKPAIKLNAIVAAVESKYGITFNSTLFESRMFDKLFMWCHRREGYMFKDQENGWNPLRIRWQSTTGLGWNDGDEYVVSSVALSADLRYDMFIISGSDVGIYVFVNGNLFATRTHTTSVTAETIPMYGLKQGDVIAIKYAPAPNSAGANFSISLDVEFFRVTFPTAVIATASTGGTLMTFDNDVVIANQMPEQKISEFITGLVKMFNLTLESVSATEFNLEPLDSWYASGSTYDITDYTDISTHKVTKPELYKRIRFEHQEANSRLMRLHRETNGGVGYGDLRADFTFDGGELATQTNSELLRFDVLVDQNGGSRLDFAVGKSLDKELEPYIGAPIIFFSGGVITGTSFSYMNVSGNHTELTECFHIGNTDDKTLADVSQTLTFGLELDPYHGQAFNETLYSQFWEDYVTDLYSPSRRVYSFKAILPMTTIYQLKMNDKLVIAGKRYVINEVNLNLRTREATLELLNDV
jgi:hypothetical protein